MSEYPLEIGPPDIARHAAGNVGLPYVWSFDANLPGPHVAISALVHGNELCGAIVLDRLLRDGLRPARGRLSLLFANVAAFHLFDPAKPDASRSVDEDFNRIWDTTVLDGTRTSVELSRARALRPFFDTVDLLLDLHSMTQASPPLALCGPTAKGRAFAQTIGYPAHVVVDQGHAAGRRLRDYGQFADESSPANAVLVECGQHWRANSVEVAEQSVARFLRATGAVEGRGAATSTSQRVVEVTDAVTIRSEKFRFVSDYRGMDVIENAGTVIALDDSEPIVTTYDDCVLIMPTRRSVVGQTAVRLGRFVA